MNTELHYTSDNKNCFPHKALQTTCLCMLQQRSSTVHVVYERGQPHPLGHTVRAWLYYPPGVSITFKVGASHASGHTYFMPNTLCVHARCLTQYHSYELKNRFLYSLLRHTNTLHHCFFSIIFLSYSTLILFYLGCPWPSSSRSEFIVVPSTGIRRIGGHKGDSGVRNLTKEHNFSIGGDPVIQLGKMEHCRALYTC